MAGIVPRMFDTRLLAAPLALSCAALAACPAGRGAQVIRSEQPKVESKDRVAVDKCDTSKSYDALTVDWDPELRGDLEVAMKEGVAVVAYDCNSLKFLPDCSLEGSYGFIGMTRKEKVVSMQDSDEITANLPLSGISFLAKIGGAVARGTSLDAAMIMIGKNNSSRKRAQRDELDEECAQATHFVRSATVGAFVLATSSAADAKVAASFFGGQGAGAQTGSSKEVHNKDGDLEDCKKASPDAKAAPSQCGALLRLSLGPIRGEALPAGDLDLHVASCPSGTVRTDEGCASPEPETAHQCEPGDAQACQAQCDKGHAGSCYVLGSMLQAGAFGKKDWKRAAALLRGACEDDHAEACRAAGGMYAAGHGVDKDSKQAAAMLTLSCDGGDALGCVALGQLMLVDKKLKAEDAQYVFRRACYGGEYEGCTWLGNMRQDGLGGMKKNPKMANKFYEKGCKEGSALACYRLAQNTRAGEGTDKDKGKATELMERACQAGHEAACSEK